MGTDCKSAAFSFGGSNPPAPTKNSGIQWVPEFLFYLSCKRGCKGGFEQQRSRPPPAAETGRRGWGSAPLFQSPAKGLRKKRQEQLVRPAEQSGGKKSLCATATTAASGRNREELLGLRPAGCACRPRHDAAAGSRDPGSFSVRLAQSTRAHQKTATYQNTLRFCFAMLFPAISASSSHQSSCARILFCTISPAGVRARMRPSKVAYPARTQFCTKASCAVENCLPYRAL